MKAPEIMARVGQTYSQCHSYSDSGYVEFDDRPGNKQRIDFRTHFVRPDYFCFEWQDYGPVRGKSDEFSTLWWNGHKSYVRWQTKSGTKVEEEPGLRLAIAGVTGCSAGAVHLSSALLMDEIRADSKNLLQLADIKEPREEDLLGERCFVLEGSLFKPADHKLWISMKNFRLLRIRSDKSWTAEESKRDHEALMANKELLAKLTEQGIAPPKEMKHQDTVFVTEYNYPNVSFNSEIVRQRQPES